MADFASFLNRPLIIFASIAAWLVCSLLFCITLGLAAKQTENPVAPFITDRLKSFSTSELDALVFVMDLAQTVEPLDELAASIREEMIEELQLRNIDQNI
jgi:hypothetical protein